MTEFYPCACRDRCPHGYLCVHLGSDGPDRHAFVGCPTCLPETIRVIRGADGSLGLDLPCGDRIDVPSDQRKWRWCISEHTRACRATGPERPEWRACRQRAEGEREKQPVIPRPQTMIYVEKPAPSPIIWMPPPVHPWLRNRW